MENQTTNTQKSDDRNVRKFITITDISLWDIMDEISEKDPRYKSSFNALINDALRYGLPMLLKSLNKDVTLNDESLLLNESLVLEDAVTRAMEKFYSVNSIVTENQFYAQLIQLLQEIVLNAIINKSMTASLFNAAEIILKDKPVNGKDFAEGRYEHTPDYLDDYELRELAKIQKKNLS